MRTFAVGVVGALSVLSGAMALCSEVCLDHNGTQMTCDDINQNFGFTCAQLEGWHCCDCTGCCEETTTTTSVCDSPCLGSYSTNDLITMLSSDCTEAINNDLAPECYFEECSCLVNECTEVQDSCGFSCDELVGAGFTCQDTLDANCTGCGSCGCVDETTSAAVDECDKPCYEEFDVSCNFLNANGYTCDMAEELGCDCTGCSCTNQCDRQLYNITDGGSLFSCNELCAPTGTDITPHGEVGNFSTLQLIRLGINCLECECYDTTPTTTTTSTTTTTTTTTTSTTSTTTTSISQDIGAGCDEPFASNPALNCIQIVAQFAGNIECSTILGAFGEDCTGCACQTTTTTTTTTTETTTTTTETTTTTTNTCADCLVSLSDDGQVYTCADLIGGYSGVGSPFGEYQGGLSDASVWTCDYLEAQYGCDCTDCGCVDPPNTTTAACPNTCFDGQTCDEVIDILDYEATCESLEAGRGCDCTACACAEGYCASKDLGISITVGLNVVSATCDLLNNNSTYTCAQLLLGAADVVGTFSYADDCAAFDCGCSECVPGCIGAENTCDDWLVTNGMGTLTCDTLESTPYNCDCSGCECREPTPPCSVPCGPGYSNGLDGLQDFADANGIVTCDDWGTFFTEETFTCAYLEDQWSCNCAGCECDAAPTCMAQCQPCAGMTETCDEITENSDFSVTCEDSESLFGCDCSGCACNTQPVSNFTCEESCLGYNCDDILPVFGGSQNCASLEGLGFDCRGCSGCEFYDICDSYRYGFSAGFIDNQPRHQGVECEGTPLRNANAFSFCTCANLCEASDDCAFFDNSGLDCRLFAADQCQSPTASTSMTGVWEKV